MHHEMFNLDQAAAHVHMDANELRHVAQRGEIAAIRRGDDWFFEHRMLDEWAQRNLLSAPHRALAAQYRSMADENRRDRRETWLVANLLDPLAIDLAVRAKAKAGVLRDMTDLADKSGKVYDTDGLFKELVAREEIASTAVGQGLAFLHPRFHDPYMFESSFIAYGRCERPVFFGAANGDGTRHFLLICSTDHRQHLHILARLAMLAHGTNLAERLDAATTPEEVSAAIRDCEMEFA